MVSSVDNASLINNRFRSRPNGAGTQAEVGASVLSNEGAVVQADTGDKKRKFTDIFQDGVKNSADLSDCIAVPRTIFKGYLGIMVGTTALTASSFIKNAAAKKSLALGGLLTSLYGTWSFVRPYILKGAVPTVDRNKCVEGGK